jgi:hypothetical protein
VSQFGSQNPRESFDACGWARKVNARWIVQAGLDRDAEDYMQHLEASDPSRLERSCQNARWLASLRKPAEDPKPWFYAGLFSLATPEEVQRFVGRHWLTCSAVSAVPLPSPVGNPLAAIETLQRIREALSRLSK